MKNKKKIFTSKLDKITLEAAEEYKEKSNILIKEVNNYLLERNDLTQLIGDNPISKMEDNHRNHASFMYNSFRLNDADFFINTISWVYRTYKNHGFSYDYFPVELKAWVLAVKENLDDKKAEPIINFYNLMIDTHEEFIKKSKETKNIKTNLSEEYSDLYDKFLKYLLQGRADDCLSLVQENIKSKKDVLLYFENVIKPAMYEIGFLWEKGEITIAKEHLASSIVSRINSSIYSKIISLETTKDKAVVSAISNEFHEIGARIISDSLESDGWDVDYLGANTPLDTLIDLLISKKPLMVGLSVSMPFNIDNLSNTIDEIKSEDKLADIKILVGGKVFNDNPNLWKKVGADAWAANGKKAVQQANKWLNNRGDKNV